jgi:crotonobetaine/carnitine-CoA ligase
MIGQRISKQREEVMICVVLNPGEELNPEKLSYHCQDQMPHFAVPRYVEFMDQLPKTQTEKIQKHKLRENGVTANTWDRESVGHEFKKG